MPAKTITIQSPLDDTQVARLGTIFGLDGPELDTHIALIAAAALDEYGLAFTERAPSTLRELRELRLRLLYDHLPPGEPADEQVALLFQMTPAQVSTLIAGTRARFDIELRALLVQEAVAVIVGAEHVDDDTVRIVVPDSLARYLRDLVAQTSAPPMLQRKDASRTYDLGRSTVEALCRQLGIDPQQVSSLKWPA